MGVTSAVRSVLRQYATFSGRATRSEFWWWVLAGDSAFAVLVALSWLWPSAMVLAFLLNFAAILPTLAVSVRRVHDLDRSGWFLLVLYVPLVGFFVVLRWLVMRGTPGANRYGPNPA